MPLTTISAANNLQKRRVDIYGGMSKGLPLANTAQRGLLVSGQAFQSWGNWIGTAMSINMIILPLPPTADGDFQPKLVMVWPAGTKLADSIRNTLATAYPGTPVRISIRDSLVLNHAEAGYYTSLGQYGDLVKSLSQTIIKDPSYLGVQILYQGSAFDVFDGARTGAAKTIAFTDLIGQPTWIDYGNVQFQVVMRSGLATGDVVTLPAAVSQGYSQIAPGGMFPNPSSKAAFSGTFTIKAVRHLGSLRNPDGGSWITVITAVPNMPASPPA